MNSKPSSVTQDSLQEQSMKRGIYAIGFLGLLLSVLFSSLLLVQPNNTKSIIKKINDQSLDLLFHGNLHSDNYTSVNLVIAHPDDEIMFFNPLLNVLSNSKETTAKIRVVCLSNGDNDGLGHIRELELEDSVKAIFHKVSNFYIYSSIQPLQPRDIGNGKNTLELVIGGMIDGMDQVWDLEEIYNNYLSPVVTDANPLLITFDHMGVSSHINHITCNKVIRKYYQNVIALKTPNFFEKYSSFMLLPYHILKAQYIKYIHPTFPNKQSGLFFINTWYDYKASLQKMRINHKSQMVWYRYFWWGLSSLVFYNNYEYIP